MGIYTIPDEVMQDVRSEKDLVVVGDVSLRGGAAIGDSTADTVGFYGTAPTASQASPDTPSTATDATDLIAIVDALITKLETVGVLAGT